jgi:hypothetical protein
LKWEAVSPGADGIVRLPAAADGKPAVAYAFKSIDSPNNQEATLLLGYKGQARVWLNGVMVHGTSPGRKDTDGPDSTTIPLRRGGNAVYVKIATDGAAPEFTFTLLSAQELKGK